MDLGETIELGGDTTHGVHSFISLITKACLAFYPLSMVISLFLMVLVGSH